MTSVPKYHGESISVNSDQAPRAYRERLHASQSPGFRGPRLLDSPNHMY